jgi:hypothetical protein
MMNRFTAEDAGRREETPGVKCTEDFEAHPAPLPLASLR